MWPFRKKEKIYNNNFFVPLSNSSIVWDNIYTDVQNNDLLIKYFNEVAEVAAPVLKYSDSASQTKFKTNVPEVEALLNNPNYYQGWNEFISLAVLYKRLLGNSIINAFAPLTAEGRKPKNLYTLSPQFIGIETNKEKDFRNNPIKNYIFNSQEQDKNPLVIESEFILHLKESNPNFKNNQYLFGESRYAGCYKNIESISSGYDAKKNLYKNGARLIITGRPQGEFASMQESEDLEDLHKRFKEYGYREQDKNAFLTDVPLDVHNVSFDVQDLQINEMNSADFQRLCDAQNIDSKIFSDNTGATFSNKEAALKDFNNNSFRSEMDAVFNDLELFLSQWWSNVELTPDYSGINQIVEANNEENERLLEDAKLGLITRNEYLEVVGKEVVNLPAYNEYYVYNNGQWINQDQNDTQNNQE